MTDWSDEVAARLELWETFGEREQGWNEQIAADIRSALGEIKRLEGIEDAHVGCVAGNWNDRALRAEAKLAEAKARLVEMYERIIPEEIANGCTTLKAEVERLRKALQPFAAFSDAWDRRPIRGLDDELYVIHSGEDRGVLRLSDCKSTRAALRGGVE